MSNVFFIGDTHFGHQGVLHFEPRHRPFTTIAQHDAKLIEHWNAVVGKRDIVWHLGDLAWSEASLLECVPQLNGRIRLVAGNHDLFSYHMYRAAGIEDIHGCVSWKRGILLTHMPTWIGDDRYAHNFHGHRHSKGVPDGWEYTHICLSAEQTDLKPMPWDLLR